MMIKNILIVEDDDVQRRQLAAILVEADRDVAQARSGEEALELLAEERFDLVISDLKMPGISGLELVEKIKSASPHTSLLLISAHATVDSAIEAMKLGVEDYLTKPFQTEELEIVVNRILEKRDLLAENVLLREQLESQFSFANMISQNSTMRKIFATVASVAPTDSTILIQGETGTGKELIATAIHFNSFRKDKRFVAVDCGGLPDSLLETELFGHEKGAFTSATARRIGKLEYTDGGTLFMDEVGNMSPAMQTKILRALEEKRFQRIGSNEPITVDIRLIAATNIELHTLVREGKFRDDLYYRLSVFPLNIPPLRERREDIPLLSRHFLEISREQTGRNVSEITEAAMIRLMRHDWPGNVRELQNAIQFALIQCTGTAIGPSHLPPSVISAPDTPAPAPAKRRRKRKLDASHVERALDEADGNKIKAARLLGVSRATLYRFLEAERIAHDTDEA
jgi:two-component system response regulator HydG